MEQCNQFITDIRSLLEVHIKKVISSCGYDVNPASLVSGKMLRSRLAARLTENSTTGPDQSVLKSACCATEMVHIASLCHDDVIDNGLIRRGFPTLWRITNPSGAILIGDLFLCEAVDMLLMTSAGRYTASFVSKIREICLTEIEQEIVLRGELLNEETAMRIARGKTGPLFGFAGFVSGGDDPDLSSALEEAAYRIGTAYQISDDYVDIAGDKHLTGKTLGSDIRRKKHTYPQFPGITDDLVCKTISALCQSALDCLAGWPRARQGLETYIRNDLQSVFNRVTPGIEITV